MKRIFDRSCYSHRQNYHLWRTVFQTFNFSDKSNQVVVLKLFAPNMDLNASLRLPFNHLYGRTRYLHARKLWLKNSVLLYMVLNEEPSAERRYFSPENFSAFRILISLLTTRFSSIFLPSTNLTCQSTLLA